MNELMECFFPQHKISFIDSLKINPKKLKFSSNLQLFLEVH